jgi:hypothetical protein
MSQIPIERLPFGAKQFQRLSNCEALRLAEPFSGKSGDQLPLVVAQAMTTNPTPHTNTVQTNHFRQRCFHARLR